MSFLFRKLSAVTLVLLVLCVLFHAQTSRAATRVTASITITNIPGVGSNWVVNGNSRKWTNSAGTPAASWIVTGATIAASATNLYNHIAANPYTGPGLVIGRTTPTNFYLSGTSVVITTNNYFSVTYSTNTGTNLMVLQLPFENVVGDTNRTNGAHWLVDGLNSFVVTNNIKTNAVVMSNYITKGAAPLQTIVSPLSLNGRVAVTSNFFATNGFTVNLTNVNPVTTNLINYGNAIRSEGSGGNSFQAGSNAMATGDSSIAVGNGATNNGANTTAVGASATATNQNGSAFGTLSVAGGNSSTALGASAKARSSGSIAIGSGADARTGDSAIAIGPDSVATNYQSISIGDSANGTGYQAINIGAASTAEANASLAIGYNAQSTHSNSAAIGPVDHTGTATATTTTNQIRLGTANHRVSIPGQLLISGTQSNTVFTGTNIAGGSWSYPMASISSIANGNNLAVPIGTNKNVRLSGTVTASPAIVGMVGGATTGGTDGQDVRIHNDTGYTVTFAQNTSDPVPANRIETYDGTDVNVANNGWIDFTYSTADSRWHVVQFYPAAIASTNGVQSVWTNGTVVTSAATNLNFIEGEGISLLVTNNSGRVDAQIKNSGVVSNIHYMLSTQLVATNTTVNSNLTVNYNIGSVDLYITNNISLTNQTGLASSRSPTTVLFISPQLVNRTVVYPTLGGASFGYRWFTNANSPMWTTLTQGVTYAISLTSRGTNVHASISEWK